MLVTVEEAPATTIGYGGGLEGGCASSATQDADGVAAEQFEFAPRGFFEIGRRNLFGKNRSVNFCSRACQPAPAAASRRSRPVGFDANTACVGTFREPRVFNTSADAFVTGDFEQQIRSSFNFARRERSAPTSARR